MRYHLILTFAGQLIHPISADQAPLNCESSNRMMLRVRGIISSTAMNAIINIAPNL